MSVMLTVTIVLYETPRLQPFAALFVRVRVTPT